MANQCKPILGLTGGTGAGKSEVAAILREHGAAVIDSDRLAHDELMDPEVLTFLKTWWGHRILDSEGQVDRRVIAEIVFQDADELARLEGLLYPRINRRREELTTRFLAEPAVRAIVIDAPKLFEAGLDHLCDAVIFVDADWPIRVARLASSRGWSETELQRRENMQKPLDKKKAAADYVVSNNSSIDHLRQTVEQVFRSVLASVS